MTTIRKDEQLIFIINDEQAGQTVREFLQGYHLSRKKIHEMYMNKKVRLNGNSVSFETILHASDELAIALFEEEEIDFLPQKMPLEIIYEDHHLLIINKPAGLMVHPDQKDGKGTLANGVAYYYERRGMKHRVRYIHRLDTETSGGIIFAKTYLAHSLLDYWLSEKKIRRWYVALVSGTLKTKKGKIDAPIGRDRHHGARRRVSSKGDRALTYYQLKRQYQGYALVELELKTGRTHQIRVHMSHLGHPLLGDVLYGGAKDKMKRLALHSARIEMLHPITREPLMLHIPIPNDMKRWIK